MAPDSKKFLITTISREFIIVHPESRPVARQYCSVCENDVEMLTLDTAVTRTTCSTRKILSYADSGTLHGIEDLGGHLLICGVSLERFLQGVEK